MFWRHRPPVLFGSRPFCTVQNRRQTHSARNATPWKITRRRRRRRRRPTAKRSDDEVVRRRRRPTTKWSDSKSMYVDVVMSSNADSFEIEFVRLSANFRRISTSKRRHNDDFEQTTSSSDAFGVGPLRGRTTSSSDAFGVAPSAVICEFIERDIERNIERHGRSVGRS